MDAAHWTADAFRVATLVLLAVATGGMVRFYLSQSRMPWLAFGAVLAATVSMTGTIAFKVAQDEAVFRWWVTPPVTVYSVLIIVALRHFLVWRQP